MATEETTIVPMETNENFGSSAGDSGSKEIVDGNRRYSEKSVGNIEGNGCSDGNMNINKVFDGHRGNLETLRTTEETTKFLMALGRKIG